MARVLKVGGGGAAPAGEWRCPSVSLSLGGCGDASVRRVVRGGGPQAYSCNPARRDPNLASRLVRFAPVMRSQSSARPKIRYIDRMPSHLIGSGSHCPET